jgi:iron complex outermembrane receptor protein
MADKTFRALTLGLLASTAFVAPAFAQNVPPNPEQAAETAQDTAEDAGTQVATEDEGNVIIVTATKREENLQDVPVSIQAIGTRRLDQLNISNFEEYTQQLPSVSYQTIAPGATVVYMRGVATGGDGNHTGSLPSVGSYLDEQPITTIGGTLDVHVYDMARIESLAGPQGTLYGASSEAGTIRLITNKPELGITTGRIDGEVNKVAHGGWGGNLEGMINLPITDNIAFRAVAFYQRDAGYIDNVRGTRTYCGDPIVDPDTDETIGCVRNGFSIDNEDIVEKNFNDLKTYGGRAALKIDLDDNWTITPTIMHQNLKTHGVFYMDKDLPDLEVIRFRKEPSEDKFTQVALTIEGKIANFDITYAGAYMHRPTDSISDYSEYTAVYDAYYESYGGIANYFYFSDNAGNPIDPTQYIHGTNNFKKLSQELRVASPTENRFRVLAGAFYQRQSNDIFQDYRVDNLADDLSVNGHPGTIWLTKQKRVDRDYALFGEASFDITPQITLTGGGRYYKFRNTVFGFAGFGRNPAFIQGQDNDVPPNAAGSSRTGVAQCFTVSGLTLREAQLEGADTTLILDNALSGTPCINVGEFEDGKVKPKESKDHGWTYRFNGTWKPQEDLMFYATWSKGFRPGGINRQPGLVGYDPDFLVNYELGWKTTFGRFQWNGAVYHQKWKSFQFSFLGDNSLTVVQNGRDAKINGIETDVSYSAGGLSLRAAAAFTDAKTKGNICNIAIDQAADCDTFYPEPTEDDPDAGVQDFIVTPSGTRLPVTPKFKMTATARYTWPVSIGRAHVQAGVAHQSSASADLRQATEGNLGVIYNPNDFLGRIKSSTLVNLFAGFEWSRYSVELYASNIFDQRNELSRFVVCSICTDTKIVPGTPRTVGLRLGAKF